MKIIAAIFGIILLIPVVIVLAGLLSVTLVGGYVQLVVTYSWSVLLILLGVWVIIRLVKKFL